MVRVTIEPGICGFTTHVAAQADDEKEMVKLEVESQCPSVSRMFAELDDTFDAFELCIQKPGKGPLFDYVHENNYPVHVSCPVIAGVIKAAEVECGLALPKDCSVHFES